MHRRGKDVGSPEKIAGDEDVVGAPEGGSGIGLREEAGEADLADLDWADALELGEQESYFQNPFQKWTSSLDCKRGFTDGDLCMNQCDTYKRKNLTVEKEALESVVDASLPECGMITG